MDFEQTRERANEGSGDQRGGARLKGWEGEGETRLTRSFIMSTSFNALVRVDSRQRCVVRREVGAATSRWCGRRVTALAPRAPAAAAPPRAPFNRPKPGSRQHPSVAVRFGAELSKCSQQLTADFSARAVRRLRHKFAGCGTSSLRR